MGSVSILWCSFDLLTSKIVQGIVSEKKCRIGIQKKYKNKVEMRALGQILGISVLQTLFSEL